MTEKEKIVREACEQQKAEEMAYYKPRKSSDNVKWFSRVIAIYQEKNEMKCKKVYIDETDESNQDKWNTFDAICESLEINLKKNESIIILIFDRALEGEMWQYGNYLDEKWYYYGKTKGYV